MDVQGLQYITNELFELSERRDVLSKNEKQRMSALISMQSAIRGGATLQDLLKDDLQAREKRLGLPMTHFAKPAPPVRLEERRAEASAWAHFLSTGRIAERDLETRDETVGGNKPGTQPQYFSGGMGSFVPRAFHDRVIYGTRIFEPLVNPDIVNFVETEDGRTLQFGVVDDTLAQAVVAGENSDQSGNEQDIIYKTEVDVRAFSYRTPLWRLSIEAFQDLDAMTTAIAMYEKFVTERISRGVGRDLLMGTGSGMPLGLIPSLQLSNAPSVVAQGSSESTGGTQSGSNSIGYSDTINLMEALDNSYVDNPGFCFICHPQTRSALRRTITKQGVPLINFEVGTRGTGMYYLHDKPVYVSYSMPQIGPAQISLVCGNFKDYWVTRVARSGDRVQVFKEAPGLIERGTVGLRCFSRWDGAMLNSSGSSIPFAYLVNHS